MKRVEFGEFVFDREQQVLLRNRQLIPIQPKVMKLLELLLERAPAVVSHEELYDALWPDVIVAPANLKNLVSDLRRVIADRNREDPFIRTVRSRGYAFCLEPPDGTVPERHRDSVPAVNLKGMGRTMKLRAGAHLLGRQDDCSVVLDHSTISRHHARLTIREHILIEDLGSKNGTFIGEQQVETCEELLHRDIFRLGDLHLQIFICDPEKTTDTVQFRRDPRSLPKS